MKKKRLLNLIPLIASVMILFFALESLSNHCYNSIENIFFDKITTFIGTNSFSPFTSQINLLTAIGSTALIPYYILKVIDPSYDIPKHIIVFRFVLASNLFAVFVVVLFILVPCTAIITGSLKESMVQQFGGSNMYTHFCIPFTFVIVSLLMDDFSVLSKKEKFTSLIPFVIYSVEIVLFMFIIKSWDEDLYLLLTIYSKAGVFGIIGVFILVFVIMYLTAMLVHKINKKTYRLLHKIKEYEFLT